MKKIEKILVATDFSQASEDALKSAVTLAAMNASKIYLLHVIPLALKLFGWTIDQSPLLKETNIILQEKIKAIRQGGVSEAEAIVMLGRPQEDISSQAEALDASVIMIGSGEKDKGDRFPLGVTAENIIRASSIPVWVVKRGSSERIKKILCPVDFSVHSRRALINAMELSRMFGAELQVLTVAEKLPRVYRAMPLYLGNGEADWEKHCQNELDNFLLKVDFGKIAWSKAVRSGEPYEEVLKAVAETGTDLLVMGSLGSTGLVRILMGSVAEKIARELPCSLVMMKAQDLVEQDRPPKTG
jgi:nucleotide-binding universal stress UspA family protein